MEWFIREVIPRLFADDGSGMVIYQYISSILDLPEPPESEIKFENVHKFFIIYLTMIFLCFVILLYEILREESRKYLAANDRTETQNAIHRLRKKMF